MTPTDKGIKFDIEARQSLARGIELLAKAVGATLGPKGRNVVIDTPFGAPRITKDGVTVARDVRLSDRWENMGARMAKRAAEQQNDEAGDGTTTVTILTNAIMREGVKAVAAGLNPMDLKRGIDMAVDAVVKHINAQTIPVKNDKDIYKIAMISANSDHTVASFIERAMKDVGRSGLITVEESATGEMDLEIVDGMMLDRGLLFPVFMNNRENQSCDLKNPVILIYDGKMAKLSEIEAFCGLVHDEGRGLLIIADSFENPVAQFLALNKAERGFQVCPVRAPAQGDLKAQLLEDISIMTGCPIFTRGGTPALENITPDMCGTAKSVSVKRQTTLITNGGGDKDILAARCRELETDIISETGADKRNLEVRLAGLASGVAVIKVGGNTDIEIKEKKDRVDDAIHAVKAAVAGGIVAGGGVALLHAHEALADLEGLNKDQNAGIDIIGKALMEPVTLIASNGGKEGGVVVGNILRGDGKSKSPAQGWKHGYNAAMDTYEDLIKAGVIDPANVVICALRNAASVAGLLITTEAMLSEEDAWAEKKKEAKHGA